MGTSQQRLCDAIAAADTDLVQDLVSSASTVEATELANVIYDAGTGTSVLFAAVWHGHTRAAQVKPVCRRCTSPYNCSSFAFALSRGVTCRNRY